MPDEYIKRSDALKALSRGSGCGNICSRAIKRIPAADVEPVRHGRWVESDLDKDYVTCSECKLMKIQNRRAWNKSAVENWGLNYCSNCGARMIWKEVKDYPPYLDYSIKSKGEKDEEIQIQER